MRIERLLAPNPGIFTGPGTNTWVLSSQGEAVVIDPGPVIESHLAAIVGELDELQPIAVLVTHTHPDHAPAANGLASQLGVPALGRAGGEAFEPDRVLEDGDVVEFGSSSLSVIATPGHTEDSTCYISDDALFSGDHIMGGSTVIIEDMAQYLDSLERVLLLEPTTIYPGHGPVVEDPMRTVTEYIEHRLDRDRQIVDAIAAGAATVGAIVQDVYSEVDTALHPAAALSVVAHLRRLAGLGTIAVLDEPAGWESTVEALP